MKEFALNVVFVLSPFSGAGWFFSRETIKRSNFPRPFNFDQLVIKHGHIDNFDIFLDERDLRWSPYFFIWEGGGRGEVLLFLL